MKTPPPSTTGTLNRLRVGDVVTLEGTLHVIQLSNHSRALAVPLVKRQVEFINGRIDKSVSFAKVEPGKNISPDSEIPIVASLGDDWRTKNLAACVPGYRELTHGVQEERNAMKTAKAKKPARGGLAAEILNKDATTPATKKRGPGGPAKKGKGADGKLSKCAFIDSLYEKGGHTKQEILDLTLKAYPDAKVKATRATVNARPSHMATAGKKASWNPEVAVKTEDPKSEEKVAA